MKSFVKVLLLFLLVLLPSCKSQEKLTERHREAETSVQLQEMNKSLDQLIERMSKQEIKDSIFEIIYDRSVMDSSGQIVSRELERLRGHIEVKDLYNDTRETEHQDMATNLLKCDAHSDSTSIDKTMEKPSVAKKKWRHGWLGLEGRPDTAAHPPNH